MNELTLRTEMFELTDDVAVDIKRLLNSVGQDAYFKVDNIADRFGKRVREFFDQSISKDRHEYRRVLIEENTDKKFTRESSLQLSTPSKVHETGVEKLEEGFTFELSDEYASTFSKEKKNYYVYNVRYNKYDLDYLAYRLDGRGKQMDPKIKGTYIHSDLAFEFFRWLSPALSVQMDKKFKRLLIGIDTLKIERKGTIDLFHELIKVSDKYYVPKQPEGYPQEYANQKLMDMINIEVLGCKASTYKKRNGITSNIIREWLTPKQLKDIKIAESHIIGMIKYAKIYDYNTLKTELHDLMVNNDDN